MEEKGGVGWGGPGPGWGVWRSQENCETATLVSERSLSGHFRKRRAERLITFSGSPAMLLHVQANT